MRLRLVWIWLRMLVQARNKAVSSGWMKPNGYGYASLRSWIHRPLIWSESSNVKRLVQVFLDYFFERSDLTESLKGVYDIERLASRVSLAKE